MSTATNSENRATRASATVVSKSDLLNQALDEIFAELPTRDDPPASPPLKPVVPHCEPAATLPAQRVAYSVYPRTRVAAKRYAETNWFYRTKQAIYVGLMLIGAALIFRGMPSSWRASISPFARSQASPASAPATARSTGDRRVRTQRIDQIRVGDRVVGRNPIREQADLVEPDPATWRKISLHMTKESGLGLCIDLLRPLPWIDEHNATPGSTIFIDLYEMGAVGDAEVTYVGPCPEIQSGEGTIVTGTFKHQADKTSNVVRLKLEDQTELTGVTDNHPYWSEDRREFVEVGELRVGELVDTARGLKHVVSVTPDAHNGFLYNLETTEHVYRVGSLGTLVHNSCFSVSKIAPDWATKGLHVHVDGIEVAIRPGNDASIVFKKVFSSTEDAAFKSAVRRLERDVTNADVRRQLFNQASRARDYLGSLGGDLATSRAGELTFLMHALEKLGL